MAKPILEVSHLTKQFKDFTAVDHISFSVREGEIVGLLGPNGAGKTTTIQMLLGLITPTSGTISYFEKDFTRNREYILGSINFASAYSELQGRMTVYQNLRIYSGLYGISDYKKRIAELLILLEIEEAKDQLFWHLSSGQKTRVILVKALLNHPKLILMDEPTASLDPDIAQKMTGIIKAMQENEGVAILYTSHNMKEVETLCDRVMFLSRGKIIAEDTPLELTKKIGISELELVFDGKPEIISEYMKKEKYVYTFPRKQRVSISLPEADIAKVLFDLKKLGIWITDIDIEKPDLEDVFLQIAKGKYEF